ncbi:MAG: hypothetical protein U0871_13560 [Gemmataceae bacterium]
MDVALSDAERACVRILAGRFEAGQMRWRRSEGWGSIGLAEETYHPVLKMLEQYGFISDVSNTMEQRYVSFRIEPLCVQVVRTLDEDERKRQEGKDIVEHFQATLRRHPVWGRVILAGLMLTVLLSAVSSITTILKNLGWIK